MGATLIALDCGANVAAAVPTIAIAANVAKPTNALDITTTLNADVEPVVLEYALTATSVSVRPAEGDAAWRRAFAREASGTQTLGGLPSGRRVWVRGGTEPLSYRGFRLPSGYVYPDGSGYIDLTAITGPTLGAAASITISGASLSWTNGNTADVVDVFAYQGAAAPAEWLEAHRKATLPAGSTRFTLAGLAGGAGLSWTWLARCRDASGGVSVGTGTTFTTTATAVTAPTPPAPVPDRSRTSGRGAPVPNTQRAGSNEPLIIGVPLLLVAADPTYRFTVQRAPDASGAPGTWATIASDIPGTETRYLDRLAEDGATYWYRVGHSGDGATDSAYSAAVSATPVPVYGDAATVRAAQQVSTLYAGDAQLAAAVQIRRDAATATTTRIARGGREGTCQHGATITFDPPHAGTPVINLRGGLVFQPNAKWGTASAVDAGTAASAYVSAPTYEELIALNPGPGSFVGRLRLRQKGSPTPQNYDFSGVAITTVGGTDVSAALANAPSADDQYTVRLTGSVIAESDPGYSHSITITVAIEVDPTGTGTYTERWRDSYTANVGTAGGSSTTTISDAPVIAQSGMTTSAKVRVKVLSVSESGSGIGSFSVRGKVNATDGAYGVSFQTSSGDVYASKTPDADDSAIWNALEVA